MKWNDIHLEYMRYCETVDKMGGALAVEYSPRGDIRVSVNGEFLGRVMGEDAAMDLVNEWLAKAWVRCSC